MSKPREVISLKMPRDHKGRFSINKALPLKDPMDLFDASIGIGNVFEDSLSNDPIEGTACKWKTVRVTDHGGPGTEGDITLDKFDRRIDKKRLHPMPNNPAANNQDLRGGRLAQEQGNKLFEIVPAINPSAYTRDAILQEKSGKAALLPDADGGGTARNVITDRKYAFCLV